MDYYGRYDHSYIAAAKRQEKYPCTKIEVLDPSEYVMYEITDDIIEDSDNLTMTYNQGITAKLSFEINNNSGNYTIGEDSPFWFLKKLKFYKGLYDVTTGNTYWFSMGVFIVSGASADDETKIISVECIDKFGMFSSDGGYSCLKTSAKIEAGTGVANCVRDLLTRGMGNTKVIDPISPIVDYALWERSIGQDIEVSSGGFLGDALIDLANTVKARIYYDENGRLRLDNGTSDYNFTHKAPSWTFDDSFTAEYIKSSLEYNYTNVINQLMVTGEDFDGQIYTYTAENNNPKSPTRVSKIGYRVGKTKENMYGYKQANVEAFAKYYLNMKTIQGLAISVTCSFLPHLRVGDVVLLNNSQYGFSYKRFMVEEISFKGTDMSVKLTNLDSLPFYSEELDT